MIKKRRVLINALAAAVQVVVSGLAFFVLYRFLYDTLGAADIGIWGTVLTTTSVSHLANLGLSGSTLIFVSKYVAQERPEQVDRVVQTAVVSIAVFMGLVLLVAYPLLARLVPWIINDPDGLPLALAVLPFALVSFWFVSVANVLLSAVEGFERVDLRNLLTIASTLLYLVLAFVLVPERGLVGLAYAQVAQAVLLCTAAWVLLKRLFAPLPPLPFRWTRATFSEMLSYNVQFQAMSVLQMLFDPTARALMARLGGLEAAGFFEMAHKMVLQLRSLIITAQQAVLPTIANLNETAPELIQDIYKKSFRLVLFLVLPSLPLLIALMPVVSVLYLGEYQPTFVLFANLLLVGWFLNILSVPAYLSYLGTGALRWNLAGHLVSGVLNAALGALLGWQYGGTGVVTGFVIALLAGNLVTAAVYQRTHAIRLVDVFERDSFQLGAVSLIGLFCAWAFYHLTGVQWNPVGAGFAMLAIYFVLIAGPLWAHSMRERLLFWISHVLLTRQP